MVKGHISPQLRLKKLIQGGRISFTSIDTSINNCGICSGIIHNVSNRIIITVDKLITLKSNKSDLELDDSLRIDLMSNRIVKCIRSNDSRLVFIENPEKSVIYGSKKHNMSYILKRANSVCMVRCINYFVMGFLKNINENILIIQVKPSEWQDKKEIKKFTDSKEWSIRKTSDLLFPNKSTHAKNLNINMKGKVSLLNKTQEVINLTEHCCDSFLMVYNLIEKVINK